MAGDLFTLFLFWELMTLAAFFLVMFDNQEGSIRAAIKYFLMSEMGALCMLLSVISIFYLEGTVNIAILSGLPIQTRITSLLLLGFLLGAGVKAGMVPVHIWLPDAYPAAPSPISALLSGVMIKVGIYLMIRVFWQMFLPIISWQFILCLIGSLTIIIGVMMALIQHDAKRLLAYHSVSQIGYMILGIGTATVIGVAGGLFHLINHALFKGLLCLGVGGVIYRTGTKDLNQLGGLARFMPVTFVTCLIAALSISGVPPFNGFVSKWMIYQGIIESGLRIKGQGLSLWWVFLAAAMFGSALTLASFMKLIHAVFLGQKSLEFRGLGLEKKNLSTLKEVHWTMSLPQIVLAGLCVVFGIFAFQLPLKYFILPSLPISHFQLPTLFIGIWQPGLATFLIIVGLFVGLIIYLISKVKVRKSSVFIGGEILPEEVRVTGVDFYQTIKDMRFFKQVYSLADKKLFDIYDYGINIVLSVSSVLSVLHTGNLHRYLIWCLLGTLILLFGIVK
ncbi:MAG: proton-conducting transporter membrane subunit [Elusimicrobiota bacterium]|nr:proton-conducting transporter membrane subunit [Elusimicrobiota bacterium]